MSPAIFRNICYEDSFGAVAATLGKDIKVADPISEILLTMHFLEVTSLPTIANVLTQFATTIRVKLDGSVVFEMSAIDLKNLLALGYGVGNIGFMSDGTGADNDVMFCTLHIPFGRWTYPYRIDKQVLLPKPDVNLRLELDVPADGNAVDGRKLTATAICVPGVSPTAYLERKAVSVTASGAGAATYIDLPYGDKYSLYDIFGFQTTGFSTATTTDTTTIEKLALQLNQTEAFLLETNLENFQMVHHNLSKSAGSLSVADTYFWIPFAPDGDLADVIPLTMPARIWFSPGDTNATRWIPGILKKP